MILPTTDITVYDVKNTLGETSDEVGDLCQSVHINKWARYKPVIYASPECYDDENWYRGGDGMCGLAPDGFVFTSLSALQSLTNVETICNGQWRIKLPAGTIESPFRLSDFRGHDTEATKFMWWNYLYTLNTYENPGTSFNFYLLIESEDDAEDIKVHRGNMTGFDWANTYLIAVVCLGTSWVRTYTSNASIGDGGQLTVNVSTLSNNSNYYVYFMMRNVLTNTYYPLTDSFGTMPSRFVKTDISPITYTNNQLCWKYNSYEIDDAVYKTFEEINPELSTAPVLNSLGYVSIKTRITNPTSASVTIQASSLTLTGTTVHEEAYQYEEIEMYNINFVQITSVTILANSYVDLILFSVNPILLWDGENYTINTTLTELEMDLVSDNNSFNVLLSCKLDYQYTGEKAWS